MSKKVIFITLASVLCLAAIGGGVYYFVLRDKNEANPTRPVNTVDYGPAKPEDSAGIKSDKDKAAAQNEGKPGTDDNPAPSDLRTEITTAQQSGNQLMIRALVYGASQGTCTLTLTKGTRTVTRTAPIGVQAHTALCEGFNIPLNDIPEGGQWNAKITATAASKTSPASERMVQVYK